MIKCSTVPQASTVPQRSGTWKQSGRHSARLAPASGTLSMHTLSSRALHNDLGATERAHDTAASFHGRSEMREPQLGRARRELAARMQI
jgi:hypothetical protein